MQLIEALDWYDGIVLATARTSWRELDSGGFAGRFRVGFDSVAHATQFAALISKNPSAQVRSSGNLVVTVSEGATPAWLFAPLR